MPKCEHSMEHEQPAKDQNNWQKIWRCSLQYHVLGLIHSAFLGEHDTGPAPILKSFKSSVSWMLAHIVSTVRIASERAIHTQQMYLNQDQLYCTQSSSHSAKLLQLVFFASNELVLDVLWLHSLCHLHMQVMRCMSSLDRKRQASQKSMRYRGLARLMVLISSVSWRIMWLSVLSASLSISFMQDSRRQMLEFQDEPQTALLPRKSPMYTFSNVTSSRDLLSWKVLKGREHAMTFDNVPPLRVKWHYLKECKESDVWGVASFIGLPLHGGTVGPQTLM